MRQIAARLRLASPLILVLHLAVGCHDANHDTVQLRQGVHSADDGTPIQYDIRGSGEVTLVLVHCWCCDRDFWREQIPAVENDYRVVTMDLPGHGASGTNRDSWSIAQLGIDVADLVNDLRLRNVILIGHSMGGPVSLAAAKDLKGVAIGIVAVDTLHNADFTKSDAMVDQFVDLMEQDFEGFMQSSIHMMFAEGADPELKNWVVAKACATNRPAALALMRDFKNVDLPQMFKDAGVPIRAINAAPIPGKPGFATNIEGNRKYADFDAVLMNGVGHFLLLEKPEEFNRILRSTIESLMATSGTN